MGVSVDASDLENAAADYERQVGLAVQSDPDIQAFVERLERAAESEDEPLSAEDLPSGDILAREFQRFLRQRGPTAKTDVLDFLNKKGQPAAFAGAVANCRVS